MKVPKDTLKTNSASTSSAFERARAKIRQEHNLRLGLAKYRYLAEPETIFALGGKFATHSAYKKLVWPNPFPAKLGDLPKYGLPYFAGFQKELAWAVSTLQVFASEINELIKLKEECEQAFLISDLPRVESVLLRTEGKYGNSLWLIEQQITYLLLSRGFKEKTEFVSSVLSEHKSPSLIRYATTWFSYRSLVGVSAAELERFLTELIPPRDGFDILTHMIMGRCLAIDELMAGKMIWEADNLSVFDRYLLLISTLQMLVSTNPDGFEHSEFTRDILTILARDIKDRYLKRLAAALGSKEYLPTVPTSIATILDQYSAGLYDQVHNAVSAVSAEDLTIEAIHIGVRAALRSGSGLELQLTNNAPRSLISSICVDLVWIESFSEEGVEAHLRLQKLVLSYASAAWASSLAAILEHQRHDERAFFPAPQQTYHGLRACAEHPLLAFCFSQRTEVQQVLHNQLNASPNSTAILALSAICTGPESLEVLSDLNLTVERTERLKAILYARHGDIAAAIRILNEIRVSSAPHSAKLEASLLLVRCYLLQGQIADCAEVASELFVKSRYFAIILPIEQIVGELLTTHNLPMMKSPTRGYLSVAIVFDAYSRYVSSSRDAERADAFNDVLRRYRVRKASELLGRVEEFSREQLVYFLRYICVPDVLDQSLSLDNTRAVEDERATILVGLSDLITDEGKQPPEEFKDELREISTRQVVRDTTQRLDRSKVYVNVDGIRRAIDVTMRENWSRYRLMAQYNAGSEALDSIERIVRSALGDLSDQVTVITLNAPLNERSSLFRKITAELWEMLTSSKEYGLNSNLSTNIRHGYVLRELRGPLVGSNLITNMDSESGSYQNDVFWTDRIPFEASSIRDTLAIALASFSRRIDEQIDILNRQLLRIRSEKTPEGLFIYSLNEAVLQNWERRWGQIESYESFIEALVDYFWKVTDANLNRVRENLYNSVSHEFNESLNKLEGTLREHGVDSYIPGIMTAINMVRPEVRSAIERVASWFTLSGNNEYQDYDLEIAYQAGLQTVKTYYANVIINDQFKSNTTIILKGSSLPIFARLFFLLLDNAAFHGASKRTALNLSVNVELTDGALLLDVRNDLSTNHDPDKLDARIAGINEDYGHEKAAELLGEEGGSGYPKIWKLLNFDLRRTHDLMVSRNDAEFVVQLVIDPRGLL